jgi:hypothetical protein
MPVSRKSWFRRAQGIIMPMVWETSSYSEVMLVEQVPSGLMQMCSQLGGPGEICTKCCSVPKTVMRKGK